MDLLFIPLLDTGQPWRRSQESEGITWANSHSKLLFEAGRASDIVSPADYTEDASKDEKEEMEKCEYSTLEKLTFPGWINVSNASGLHPSSTEAISAQLRLLLSEFSAVFHCLNTAVKIIASYLAAPKDWHVLFLAVKTMGSPLLFTSVNLTALCYQYLCLFHLTPATHETTLSPAWSETRPCSSFCHSKTGHLVNPRARLVHAHSGS